MLTLTFQADWQKQAVQLKHLHQEPHQLHSQLQTAPLHQAWLEIKYQIFLFH